MCEHCSIVFAPQHEIPLQYPAHWDTPNNATSRHPLQKEPLHPRTGGKGICTLWKSTICKSKHNRLQGSRKPSDGSFLNTEPNCKHSLYLAPPHCLLLSQNQNLLFLIPFWSRTPQGVEELGKVPVPRKSRHPVRWPHHLRAAPHQTAQFAFFQVGWEPIKLPECWGLCVPAEAYDTLLEGQGELAEAAAPPSVYRTLLQPVLSLILSLHG